MRLDITGRHVELTPALRQLIEKRLARMTRVLNDAAVSTTVTISKEKYRHRTEIVVHTRGDHMLSGMGEATSWTLSVRDAAEKIEQQAKKLKSKWVEGKRKGPSPRVAAAPPGSVAADVTPRRRVIRATRYAVKPMSVEDAATRIDGASESFVVFRNAESDAVTILYRRKDGNLGLIEPD
jgi:putative sigma-54 modulation protein